jgi:hypothetical protein
LRFAGRWRGRGSARWRCWRGLLNRRIQARDLRLQLIDALQEQLNGLFVRIRPVRLLCPHGCGIDHHCKEQGKGPFVESYAEELWRNVNPEWQESAYLHYCLLKGSGSRKG